MLKLRDRIKLHINEIKELVNIDLIDLETQKDIILFINSVETKISVRNLCDIDTSNSINNKTSMLVIALRMLKSSIENYKSDSDKLSIDLAISNLNGVVKFICVI